MIMNRKKLKLQFFIILLTYLYLFFYIQSTSINNDFPSTRSYSYSRERIFLNNKYRLLWSLTSDHVHIMIQANTYGWIGFGVQKDLNDPQMKNSDIMIGYYDSIHQEIRMNDYYGLTAMGEPKKDTSFPDGKNSLLRIDGWEDNGWTILCFTKSRLAEDKYDNDFSMIGIVPIIVAYGETDDFTKGHTLYNREKNILSSFSSLSSFTLATEYRTFNGTGNNIKNPNWGSVGTKYKRKLNSTYIDGIQLPNGIHRPIARNISNILFGRANKVQPLKLTNALVFFGQFIAHDITLAASSNESLPIYIPQCDSMFDPNCNGPSNMSFLRTMWDPSTGTNTSNPREQINLQTAFVDGSQIYGQDKARADFLRTFIDGKLLVDSFNLLPSNGSIPTPHGFMASEAQCPCNMRLAGDVRANENTMLFSLHVVFTREHNRWCDTLKSFYPNWNDETLYQEARRRTIALLQKVTFYEYLPAVLGRPPILWESYNSNIIPQLTHAFTLTAFRYGHSELTNHLLMINDKGETEKSGDLLLRENLFDAIHGLYNNSIESGIRGISRQRPNAVDTLTITDVRNFLFGNPRGTLSGASDIVSRSIHRGREHGIPDYNSYRLAYNLSSINQWSDITSNIEEQQLLQSLYPSINDIDLYVAGLTEEHSGTTIVGPLYAKILEEGFNHIRDGDRFWFENNQFSIEELQEIIDTRLSDIIRRNTKLNEYDIPDNIFYLDPSIQNDKNYLMTTDGFPDTKTYKFTDSQIIIPNIYKILWTGTNDTIRLMLQVKTLGWMGIGFKPEQKGMMKGADIIIGRILNDNRIEIKDYKAIINVGKPKEDVELSGGGKNDIENIDGWEENGWSIITFNRKRNTKDIIGDVIIPENESIYTIFAFQDTTDDFYYHGPNVAGSSILFKSKKIATDILFVRSYGLTITGRILSGIGIVFTFICFIFQTIYRKRKLISYSSPRINIFILLGVISCYISIIIFGMKSTDICKDESRFIESFHNDNNKPNKPCIESRHICSTRLWLLSLGFSFVFAPTFAKTYRVYKIFTNAKLSKLYITDKMLLKIIGNVISIEFIILIIYTIVDIPTAIRFYTNENSTSVKTIFYVEELCNTNNYLSGIVYGYNILLLLVSLYMAILTRNIKAPGINDYYSTCLVIFSISLILVIILPVLQLLNGKDDNISYFLVMIGIFLSASIVLIIIYIPKMYLIYNNKDAVSNLLIKSSGIVPTSNTHTVANSKGKQSIQSSRK